MSAKDTGPTLERLAQRLEALERENATLRRKVATLENSETEQGAEPTSHAVEEKVSRRALLGKAAAAAVAATAAGPLLTPREAKAATVEGSGTPGVHGVGTANGSSGVRAELGSGVTTGHGVLGYGKDAGYYGAYGENNSSGGYGVSGLGDTGVRGVSTGVGSSGVYGEHNDTTEGYGVLGVGRGTQYAGVKGTNQTGAGVIGESAQLGYEGVYGKHLGQGYGVVGDGAGAGFSGVLGRNSSGYGGVFEGGKAQLKLTPKSTTGRPNSGSHQKGELYLDSAATLFVCTRSGTPGTWRKVTTTAA